MQRATTNPDSKSPDRLPGLDLVRVLAVYFIILSHSGLELFRGIGVPFLLALSGFLITKTLINDFERKNTIRAINFWRNRALRIAPAYYTFLIFAYVLDTIILNDTWEHGLLIYSALHAVNYYNALYGHSSGMVAHLWTLSTMEQFYLVYPLVLLLAFKTRKPCLTISLIIIVNIFWKIFIYSDHLNIENKIQWLYNTFDSRLDSLLIGSLAAFYLKKKPYSTLSLPNYMWLAILMISFLLLNLARNTTDLHYTAGYALEGGLALINMLAIMKISEISSFAFINGTFINNIAKVSYPMYLYHPIGLGIGFKFFENFLPALLLGTIATLILATGSFIIIEKPFMRLRSKNKVSGALR